jgi:tripartite-type tricarboxylate transporter receptor subunit TctC
LDGRRFPLRTGTAFSPPRGTQADIVAKLNAATAEALADDAVRSRFVNLGMEAFPPEQRSAAAFGALQKADAQRWWPIIREAGLKGE